MNRFCARGCATALLVVGLMAPASRGVDLIGYLPYYRMGAAYNNSVLPVQLGMLNEIRYFGLTAGNDGSIQPLAGSGSLQTHKNNIATIKQKIEAMPIELRPRLDITFGGAGEATNFATVAASPALSATFAQNISSLLNETGATALDIDWESPTSSQFSHYGTLLQRIKQELGPTRRVYATIEPQLAVPTSMLGGANAIDGISLMTYELAWWANDPADPNRGEHSLPQYVTDSFDAWNKPAGSTNRRPYVFSSAAWGRNVAADKLGVGLPFFGRVIGTSQAPQGGAAYMFSQLVASGTPDASGNYYTYFGQNVWTAGPALAAERMQFAHQRGLDHVIIWELGQDVSPTSPNSLLRAAFLKNRTLNGDFDGDRDVDPADYGIWRATIGSTSDLRADGNGNGTIDAGDYVIWRKHAAPAGNGATSSASVPEPGVISALLSIGYFAMCQAWHRRHSR